MSRDQFQNKPSGRRPPPKSSSLSPVILIVSIVSGVCLVLCLCGGVALLLPAVQQAREAARRSQSSNNLKQIGLALHNYHSTHHTFPPGATVDEAGVSHHSWITQILPFIDQNPLYERVDFDVPWNDPANSGVFVTLIPTLLNLSENEKFTASGNAVSHYAGNMQVMFDNSMMPISEMTDGTSNTILGGEVHENLHAWGDPHNVRDPALGINSSPDGFGRPVGDGALILMSDGSVRFMSENVDPAVLKALSTPAAGDDPGAWR